MSRKYPSNWVREILLMLLIIEIFCVFLSSGLYTDFSFVHGSCTEKLSWLLPQPYVTSSSHIRTFHTSFCDLCVLQSDDATSTRCVLAVFRWRQTALHCQHGICQLAFSSGRSRAQIPGYLGRAWRLHKKLLVLNLTGCYFPLEMCWGQALWDCY